MRNLTTKMSAKVTAIVLLVACLFMLAANSFGLLYVYGSGVTSAAGGEYYENSLFKEQVASRAEYLVNYYWQASNGGKTDVSATSSDGTSVYYDAESYQHLNLNISIYYDQSAANTAAAGTAAAANGQTTTAAAGTAANGQNATVTAAGPDDEIFTDSDDRHHGRLDERSDTEYGLTPATVDEVTGSAVPSASGTLVLTSNDLSGTADYSAVYKYSNGITAVATVMTPMQYIDELYVIKMINTYYSPVQNWGVLIEIVLAALCFALLAFLIVSAGRRPCDQAEESDQTAADASRSGDGPGPSGEPAESGSGTADGSLQTGDVSGSAAAAAVSRGYVVRPRQADKIPLDLTIVAVLLAIPCLLMAGAHVIIYIMAGMPLAEGWSVGACAAVLVTLAALTGIWTVMTCSVRFKLGKWWRNTLIYRVWKWLCRIGGRALGPVGETMHEGAKHVAVQWKLAGAVIVAILLNLAAGAAATDHDGVLFAIIVGLADIAFVIFAASVGMMLLKLKKCGEQLAAGDLEAKVDTEKMIGDFREHGENLNNVSGGMARAIEQKMKSERLKTELITNVSHDIKTPLTSIINYIDLLKKETDESRKAEYIGILERQSQRLKKLTEDLVEASKASTGNISVDLRRTDIRETVNQAIGEYSERLDKSGLEVVVNLPEEPVCAMADGRLLWRTIDNLLSNVCKYSLPGTRVYVSASEYGEGAAAGSRVLVSIRNISRYSLNIPVDELTERFVRGDASRTSATEGSGLGLNIAKSLTELQGGRLEISIDGDLFKAEIILNRA